MGKLLVGKVNNALSFNGRYIVVIGLSQPLSANDVITFDGWQEGITQSVGQLTQNHKTVNSASSGIVSVSSSFAVVGGVNVYKVTPDEGVAQTAQQGASSQAQQGAGVIIPAGIGMATAQPQQQQGQAPAAADTTQAQQNIGMIMPGVGGNIFKRAFTPTYYTIPGGIQSINLAGTNTEFLKYAPSYTKQLKAKSTSHFALYLIVAAVIILPVIIVGNVYAKSAMAAQMVLITLFGEFLVAGALLLYMGFSEFSLDQSLSSTPVVKLDVATYNLNKMQGKFIPYNTQTLKSPITGADCIYYSIGVYAVYYQGSGTSRVLVQQAPTNTVTVQPVAVAGKGVPALFTDDNGYLAIDMVKAPELQLVANALEITKKGIGAAILGTFSGVAAFLEQGKQIANELMPKINEAASRNGVVDLSQITDFSFKQFFSNKIRNIKSNLEPGFNLNTFQKFRLFMMEQYIPVNSDYTCIGGAADINKGINGKPVKVMVPDQRTGVMAVHYGNAQKTTKGMGKMTLLNLAIGILFVIIAFGILSVYMGVASAATATNTTTPTTTIIPSGSSVPQPSSSQTTTIPTIVPSTNSRAMSCGNLTLSELSPRSTASRACGWAGGNIAISAGGGLSGFVSVDIVGADGKTYFSKGTDNWCAAQIGSVYLPAQNYTVSISSGNGGGTCSSNPNATVILHS